MKKHVIVMITLGVALLLFAYTVPPYVQGQARTIATDLDRTLYSTGPQGYTHTEHLVSAPTENIDEIRLRVEHEVTDGQGVVVAEFLDEVTLIGHSRFPVIDPTASLSGLPDAHDGEVREGLHYFFPANTLQNSYQYYDLLLDDTEPVDYVSRDGDFFTFHQDLDRTPLADGTDYSVRRTLEVDRNSGIILGRDEHIILHTSTGDTTLDFAYTGETRDYLIQEAEAINRQLSTAKVLDFFAKFLGLVLIGVGVFRTGILTRR